MHSKLFASALGLAAVALGSASASAAVVTYDVTYVFSGTVSQGTAPFATLTFDDTAVANAVRLTVTAPGIISPEFISQLNFNVDTTLDSDDLTFGSFTVLSGALGAPTVSTGNDSLSADGAGRFDVQFDFPTTNQGNGAQRFGPGESFSIDIAGIAGLTANSFNFTSVGPGGNAPQLLAMHIQGINTGDGSGWHGANIPEPATASLGLLGLTALGLRRRGR